MKPSVKGYRTADAMLRYFSVYDKFGNREKSQAAAKKPTSDKSCPNCGNTHLVLLRTHNQKVCTDCDTRFDWNLDPGQKSVGY